MSETNQHAARMPNAIDVHVGNRLRARRGVIHMSQEALGDEIGVTFQQVQKYEKGSNRISASKLLMIANSLRVDPNFFYAGYADFSGMNDEERADVQTLDEFIQSQLGPAFMEAILKLPKRLQKPALQLLRAMGGDGDEEE